MDWINKIWSLVNKYLSLEKRVSQLESRVANLHTPTKDIRENLNYNSKWNLYVNKSTEESFCPVCLGNGKKIPVSKINTSSGEGWNCHNCRASKWEDNNLEVNGWEKIC